MLIKSIETQMDNTIDIKITVTYDEGLDVDKDDLYYFLGANLIVEHLKQKGINMVDKSDIDVLIRKYFPEIDL
jgi:hypothetical protein